MSGLVETVRKQVDKNCVTSGRLQKQGCIVLLKGAPKPHLAIDFDKPGSPVSQEDIRCDYLFVADDADVPGWVVPLELKRGAIKANSIVQQLQAGARAAEQLVSRHMAVNFRPVIAYGGGINKAERSKLKGGDSKVKFHGTLEDIRLIKCGSALVQGFKS